MVGEYICNIYAPNKEEPAFLHEVNKMIGEIEDGYTIISGDYNQVQEGVLDKMSFTNSVSSDRIAIHLIDGG